MPTICNICELPRCKRFDSTNKCTGFLKPENFKMPMLSHLASDDNKVSNLEKVLRKYHLYISERNEYPFFTLWKKSKRGQ